jgi:hypothetical protein
MMPQRQLPYNIIHLNDLHTASAQTIAIPDSAHPPQNGYRSAPLANIEGRKTKPKPPASETPTLIEPNSLLGS